MMIEDDRKVQVDENMSTYWLECQEYRRKSNNIQPLSEAQSRVTYRSALCQLMNGGVLHGGGTCGFINEGRVPGTRAPSYTTSARPISRRLNAPIGVLQSR